MENTIDEAIDFLIIHLIKGAPFMYNKRNPNYMKKNDLKRELFETISQAIFQDFEYNLTIEAIETRWKDLCKKFTNEKAKLKEKPKSGSGADGVKEKWALYDDMLFLDEPGLKHRRVVSSMVQKDSEEKPVNSLPSAKNNTNHNKIMPPNDAFCKKRKIQNDTIDKEITEMKSIIKDAIKSIAAPTTINTSSKDENNDMYAEVVVQSLKKVPGSNLFNCILRINEIIKKYNNTD